MAEPQGRSDDTQAMQGRVFWLPAKKELLDCVVRRAHGQGAVEEGIYHHPIVAISHPAEDVIHFHLITSLQGKRLEELYDRNNVFHINRRSWYLPVAPAPDHPDAWSKKTKKRFPTLYLKDGAKLRSNSYVNLRDIYMVNLSHVKEYINTDNPVTNGLRFERDSTIRILAKCKTLTKYEPGPQYVHLNTDTPDPSPT